jgi:hypothetical protein
MMTDYNNPFMNKLIDDNNSEKQIAGIDNTIPSKGPIKPIPYPGISAQSSLKSETIPSGFENFDDDNMSENRQHRYSQHSNKSLESRNRNKNSMSQKKPPSK